jgi:GNAT superfamily N-acetyltransferase
MTDVRPATERDVPALCDLYLDFHEFHAERLPLRLSSLRHGWKTEKVSLAERLREILHDPDSAVLLAEVDGELVGFSEIYVREDDQTAARPACRYSYLQSMFVRESHRRAGVGRDLLSASETWSKSRGAAELRLDVWEFPEGPAGFYEACGYRTYRRSLTRRLP